MLAQHLLRARFLCARDGNMWTDSVKLRPLFSFDSSDAWCPYHQLQLPVCIPRRSCGRCSRLTVVTPGVRTTNYSFPPLSLGGAARLTVVHRRQDLDVKTELLERMTAELEESQTQRLGAEAAMVGVCGGGGGGERGGGYLGQGPRIVWMLG